MIYLRNLVDLEGLVRYFVNAIAALENYLGFLEANALS